MRKHRLKRLNSEQIISQGVLWRQPIVSEMKREFPPAAREFGNVTRIYAFSFQSFLLPSILRDTLENGVGASKPVRVEVLLSWQKVDILYTRALSTTITTLPNSEIVSTSRDSQK
jgi:hypothetical protein